MAQLIITTGPWDSNRSLWAQLRGEAGGWVATSSLERALNHLEAGTNVVLDNEELAQYDIDIKAFKRERNYEEETNGL